MTIKDTLFKLFSFKEKPHPKRYLFIHVRKTAGTSFRWMLSDIFPEEQIFANRSDLHQNKGFYPSLSSYLDPAASRLDSTHLLAGHLPYAVRDAVSKNLNCLTFLRDPLPRVISQFKHVLRHYPPVQHLSVEEAFEAVKPLFLRDHQCSVFADKEVHTLDYFLGKRPMDEAGLKRAKRNLQRCEFIGLTERLEESIQLAEATFGWRFTEIKKRNVAPKDSPPLPEAIMNQLPGLVSYDLKLYEFAKAEFEKRLQVQKHFRRE